MSQPEFGTPGTKMIDRLREDIANAKPVYSMAPCDVGDLKNEGMRAVLALATTLGLNVLRKKEKPIMIRSRTGETQPIPTDTSMKFSVFVHKLNFVIRYTETAIPTPELGEDIITKLKLSPSYAQEIRKATGRLRRYVDDDPKEEPVKEFVPTERVEPTLSHAGQGQQYVSKVMETVTRQLLATGDEQVRYRCLVCGMEFETKKSCGSHYQVHIKDGTAKPVGRPDPITLTPKNPEHQVFEPHAPFTRTPSGVKLVVAETVEPEPASPRGLEPAGEIDITFEAVAEMVRELIRQATVEIVAERDAALAEVERLKNSLKSLRDLIGGEL